MGRFLGACATIIMMAIMMAGCGSPGVDDEFMKVIGREGISISAGQAETVAHDVCDSFRRHPEAKKVEVVTALAIKRNWTPQQAGVFTGASIGAYCIEFKSRPWE